MPPLAELHNFLETLPISTPLDGPFPSLRGLRRQQLQWQGLLPHLASSLQPFVSCLWSDEETEHLILFSPRDAGRLVHMKHSSLGNGMLHAHACSTHAVSHVRDLVTATNERIANAIATWIFTSAWTA